MTDDQQSENNTDSGMESTWIPLSISSAERTEVASQYYINAIPEHQILLPIS
jgi:hypothetical protein